MDQETIDLIQSWLDEAAKLEAAKEQELQLRYKLVKALFNHDVAQSDSEIRYSQNLPNPDYKVTADCKLTFTLDQDELESIFDELRAMEDGEWIITNLFKRKYEIVKRIYSILPPHYKAVIDKVLTIKPATPQVKFVSPKESKDKGTLL